MSYFINTRKVTAKNPYHCEFCRKEIATSAEHDYHFCVIDGDVSSYRTHQNCTTIMQVEATEDNDGLMPISLAFDCAYDRLKDAESGGWIPELEEFYGLPIIDIITCLSDAKQYAGLADE